MCIFKYDCWYKVYFCSQLHFKYNNASFFISLFSDTMQYKILSLVLFSDTAVLEIIGNFPDFSLLSAFEWTKCLIKNMIYGEKSIPMIALWCPTFINHG